MGKTLVKTTANITSHEKSPIELFLDERYVTYEYFPEFPLDMVDEVESVKNQARFQALIPEVWKRYSDQMKSGAQFPALIAVWLPNGKIKIIDGNHRFKGKRDAKFDTHPAYIIPADTPDQLIQVLTYEANARLNGQPPSDEERVQHAIHLVETGATQGTAASITGVSLNTLSRSYNLYKADRRVRSLGISKGWSRLSPDSKLRLNQITSDPPFEAAIKFASEANLNNMLIKELTSEVKQHRSDAEKLSFIEEQREVMRRKVQESGSGILQRGGSSARHTMLLHLGAILNADPQAILATCFSEEQREQMLGRIVEGMGALEKVFDLLTDHAGS